MIDPLTILRIPIGLTMLIFGINQFINPKSWLVYLPDTLVNLIALPKNAIMGLHSVGNIFLGLMLLLWILPDTTLWLVFFWWLSILPFAYLHNWRVGLRDTVATAASLAMIIIKTSTVLS